MIVYLIDEFLTSLKLIIHVSLLFNSSLYKIVHCRHLYTHCHYGVDFTMLIISSCGGFTCTIPHFTVVAVAYLPVAYLPVYACNTGIYCFLC